MRALRNSLTRIVSILCGLTALSVCLFLGFSAVSGVPQNEDKSTAPHWPLFDPSAVFKKVPHLGAWFEYGTKEGTLYELSFRGKEAVGIVAGEADFTYEKMAGKSWRVYCAVDPMDDSKQCSISRDLMDNLHIQPVFALVYGSDQWLLCVGHDLYPGSAVQIRVDAQPMHEVVAKDGCFSLANSKAIKNEIASGNLVKVRYVEWPYKNSEVLDVSTYGYNVALKLVEWLIGTIPQ